FHRTATAAEWNGKPIDVQLVSAATATDIGDTIELRWSDNWNPKQKRTLVLSYELATGSHLGSFLAVTSETFFSDPDSWNPRLLAPKGIFGTGGVAPKKWNLSVRVPSGFLIDASGSTAKKSGSHGETVYSFSQKAEDFAPFAAGGKYTEKEVRADGERILFWTLHPVDSQAAQNAANSISRRAHYYENEYGKAGKEGNTIRMLECVIPTQNFGCGALPQTIFVHQAWIARGLKDEEFYDDVNFELAYTWFGGVSRVRFDESPLPMDALAPYAGWEAKANEEGGAARNARIRWLLGDFDKHATQCKDKIILPRPAGSQGCSYSGAWSKSGLFFFALEDKIGRKEFHAALKNMIQYRRARDMSIEDLISSIETESHQQQGPFVRQWLKDPGIPSEFRARYSGNAAPAENSSLNSNTKETQP
ncbi:MAG: hypothetical protein JSS69_14600, partial [Acidobacteria bacterium]|nr:hypothetical protein [Acidobacteriota bacterium]